MPYLELRASVHIEKWLSYLFYIHKVIIYNTYVEAPLNQSDKLESLWDPTKQNGCVSSSRESCDSDRAMGFGEPCAPSPAHHGIHVPKI
jgi:hypothetical protein